MTVKYIGYPKHYIKGTKMINNNFIVVSRYYKLKFSKISNFFNTNNEIHYNCKMIIMWIHFTFKHVQL